MIAAAESSKKNTSHVMSVEKFERFFRIAAALDIDKQDLKRYSISSIRRFTTSWFALKPPRKQTAGLS